MTQRRLQQSGANRARWLAELAGALAAARQLADRLEGSTAHGNGGALTARLSWAIAEVEALRRGGGFTAGAELHPNRFHLRRDRRGSDD